MSDIDDKNIVSVVDKIVITDICGDERLYSGIDGIGDKLAA